jgi:hypothetical protein
MQTPPTIKEEGTRWTVENARPRAMRVVIGLAAPIVLALLGFAVFGDLEQGRWVMAGVRVLFALVVLMSTVFSLFGSESLAIESGELVWRRGKSQQRRCALGDVERFERQGNHLRVHARGLERPIVVGVGLRQQPTAIQWLAERVQAAITAARKDT